jgi:SagB-type dehydrogenase family enzyme
LFDDFELIHFFHENSKRHIHFRFTDPNIDSKPLSYKEYNDRPRILLPDTDSKNKVSVEDAIARRHSCRNFESKPVTLKTISNLLKFGNGITGIKYLEGFEFFARSSPSAGALYPCEIYPVIFNAEGLKNGIYHYSPLDHSLEFLNEGDFVAPMSLAFLNQYEFIHNASICMIISGVIGRTAWKYGARGYRFLLLEAGHLIQNICLISTSEGLGTLPLGGFYDDILSKLLGLDPVYEPAIYGLAIGYESPL